jgi:hypothetical protein
MSISNMKKNRGNTADLQARLKKTLNTNTFEADERYWLPVVDKAGNGKAVIRFLPAPDGESNEFVTLFSHAFKRDGGWYIENSRTTLGKDEKDPVIEHNDILWNKKGQKDIVSFGDKSRGWEKGSKRNKHFIVNILVVKHEARPEDEGKVFLYKFGAKIMDKITSKTEDGENVFDFWDGRNFVLKIRKFEGNRNYDNSEWESPSQLAKTDAELEAIWKRQYSLAAEVAPDKFKSYDDLKKRLDKVLNNSGANVTAADEIEVERSPAARFSRTQEAEAPAASEPSAGVPWDENDGDDAFFANLAARR